MDVGVRELKQNLSAYLDQVANGDAIVVTDRGKPKARIVPIIESGHLQRGIDEGWIRPPTSGRSIGSGRRFAARRRSDDVLTEDRGQ